MERRAAGFLKKRLRKEEFRLGAFNGLQPRRSGKVARSASRNDKSIKKLVAAFEDLEATTILNETDPATGRNREVPAREAFLQANQLAMV